MPTRQVTVSVGKVAYTVEVPANPRRPQSTLRVIRRNDGGIPIVIGDLSMEAARVVADVMDVLDGVRHRHTDPAR